MRNGAIASVVGFLLAWRIGGFASFPLALLLALWPTFGGHTAEILFLNFLRPRVPAARAVQIAARLTLWFVAGISLGFAMAFTASLMGVHLARWPAWWIAGLAFIGIELVVHLAMQQRGLRNFCNGRG